MHLVVAILVFAWGGYLDCLRFPKGIASIQPGHFGNDPDGYPVKRSGGVKLYG
jgi:hypothetical protein